MMRFIAECNSLIVTRMIPGIFVVVMTLSASYLWAFAKQWVAIAVRVSNPIMLKCAYDLLMSSHTFLRLNSMLLFNNWENVNAAFVILRAYPKVRQGE